jgi:hypothetical protein
MIAWQLTNSSTFCAFSAKRGMHYLLRRSQNFSITSFALGPAFTRQEVVRSLQALEKEVTQLVDGRWMLGRLDH